MVRPSFINDDDFEKLLANGYCNVGEVDIDPWPVLKLFTPDANATWLLTEIDPNDEDLAFGLCDLGLGFPELGNVRLSELASLRGRLGLPIEKDIHFEADQSISAYAKEAKNMA